MLFPSSLAAGEIEFLAKMTENSLYLLALLNPVSKVMFLSSYDPPLKRRHIFELAWKSSLAALIILIILVLLILIVGLIYIIETVSVILQVGSYKLFKKRIFKMAPIHHHFEQCNWSERKIVTVAASITAVLCAISYFLSI